MDTITATCTKCAQKFLILDREQKFLKERGLPNPTQCPSCRQERRLTMLGGRSLFKTTCTKCGKEIIVSYDPKAVTNTILCKQDYEKYFEENDPIITEPLPED